MPTHSANTNVFVRDLATGTTTLVSATPGGLGSDGYATEPVFSPDGQSLAYVSNATDLTSNPQDPDPRRASRRPRAACPPSQTSPRRIPASRPPPTRDRRLHRIPASRPTPRSPRPSRRSWVSCPPPQRLPLNPGLPTATATTSAGPIPSMNFNVFLTNLTTGTTSLVSVTPQGQLSSGMAMDLVFSPDGRYLAFTSSAVDLTNNPFEASPPSTPGASSNSSARARPLMARARPLMARARPLVARPPFHTARRGCPTSSSATSRRARPRSPR